MHANKDLLCDTRPVPSILWDSFSSSVKWVVLTKGLIGEDLRLPVILQH